QVKVVAEPGAADRDPALVGGARQARPDHDPGREVEDVLQGRGPRLIDLLLRDDGGASGHALPLFAGFLFRPRALVRLGGRLDAEGRKRWRRLLAERGGGADDHDEHEHHHHGAELLGTTTFTSDGIPPEAGPRWPRGRRRAGPARTASASRPPPPLDR